MAVTFACRPSRSDLYRVASRSLTLFSAYFALKLLLALLLFPPFLELQDLESSEFVKVASRKSVLAERSQ